ncbi:MAG: ABC transporter permease [Anaerolineales bacterium]|nr:ABC transporter permease [Anaerolineales bacterium]
MKRFVWLVRNEFKLALTAVPIQLIAIFQPTLMYVLMATIMVTPTFDMRVVDSSAPEQEDLLTAMAEVGSPIGVRYINPILVDADEPIESQVVSIENYGVELTAVQHYGYIDSNVVKNYRNRLTASVLNMWNQNLGGRAVTIEQYPWMPEEIPYITYFGMALLPTAAFIAAAMIGGYLTAQEFEFETITEYRLSPLGFGWVLAARLTRLVLTGLFAASFLMLATGLITGRWPSALWPIYLALLPVTVVAGCLGMLAGLLLRSTLPTFVIALGSGFGCWLLGDGFGLAAGFNRTYEAVSRFTPNAHVVELTFPYYYFGYLVGDPGQSVGMLLLMCVVILTVVTLVYRQRVRAQQG